MRWAPTVAVIAVASALLAGGIWYNVATWRECRSFGHSWFYCLRMVSR